MMDWCPMLSRFLFAAFVASGPGLTEAIFPWRQVRADGARSYQTSVEADANKAIVAAVAVRHPLYVRIWANQGDHLKVRAVQRATIGEDVLEDVFRTSLVIVAPINTTSRVTQGLRDFGSDEMIEDQFHRPPGSQVSRYRVWTPPMKPKSIVNPFLPRADALVAETEYRAQVSGWHFWIVADIQHTTRRCQIRNQGKLARSSPELTEKCAAFVAVMAELGGNSFGFWDLIALPQLAAQVHRWEGINVATIVLPALVVAVGAVFVQRKVCQRWIRHGESLLLGFLVCDAILWLSVAMYCGTAAHRVVIGMVFIGRGLVSFLDFLVILLLTLAQMVFCSVSCASWAYLRCNLSWPAHRRALLMFSSLASFICFGAGTFAGPMLGILASVLPLNFLTTHLPFEFFIAMFCRCMDILCCGCLVPKAPPVTKIDLRSQTNHKVVLVTPPKLQDDSLPHKPQDDSLPQIVQDDSLPHKPVMLDEEAEDTDSLSPPDEATAEVGPPQSENPSVGEALSPDGDPLRALIDKWTVTCKSPPGAAADLPEDMLDTDEGAVVSNAALPERPRPAGGAGLRLAPLGAGDLDPLAGVNSSPGLSHGSQDMSPQSPLAFAPGFMGSRPMGVPPPPKRPPPGRYSARSLSPPAPPATPPPNNRMPRLTPPGSPTGPSPPPSRSRPSPIRSRAQALGSASPASSSSSSPRDAGQRAQDHHSPLASPSTTTATSISDSLTKGRPGPIRLQPLPKRATNPIPESLSESVGRRRRKLAKSPPAMTGTATSDSDSDEVSGVHLKGKALPEQVASPTLKPLSQKADRRRRKLAKSPLGVTGKAASDSDSESASKTPTRETPQQVASPTLKPLSQSADRRRRKLAKSPLGVTGKAASDSDSESASKTPTRERDPSQQANPMPKAVEESTGRRKRKLPKSALRTAGTATSDSDSDLGRDIVGKGKPSHTKETSEEGFQPPGRKQAFPGLMNAGASPTEPASRAELVSRGSTGTSVDGLGATNTSLELGASASNFMSPAKLLANAVQSGHFQVPGPPWTKTDELATAQEAPRAPPPLALASLPQRLANLQPRPTSASVSSGGLPVEQARSADWCPPESGARTPPRQSPQDANVMSGPSSEGLLLRQPNMELKRLPPVENTRSDDGCLPEASIRTPPRQSSRDTGSGGAPRLEGLILRQPNVMAGRTSTASSLPLEDPIPEDWAPAESGSRTPLRQSPRTTGSSWSQNVPMLRCPVVFHTESLQPCEVGTRRDDDWCPPASGARTPPTGRSGMRTPTRLSLSGTPRETAADWSPAASRATSRGGTPTPSRRGTPTPSRSVTPRASQTPMTGEELRQLRLNLPQRRCSTPPQVLTPPSQHSFNLSFEQGRRSM